MKADYHLAVLAAQQAGYLSRQQIDEHGLTAAAVKWRVKAGTLRVVRKGLFRVDGIGGNYRALIRGAMAILPDPTVSHESAAEIHGIPFVPRRRSVVTVHQRTTHDFPGVQVHRSLDMIEEHRQLVDSIWTTTPARTLNDLAAVLHPQALRNAMDDSLASQLVSIGEVQRVFDQVARRGRAGCGEMRKVLNERIGSELVSASRLERLGMKVFALGGLPTPIWQYPAPWDHEKRIDFAWPQLCVACECDSRRWHTRVEDFQRDRDRDNLSLVHGWRVFRFTWDDFRRRSGLVIAQLQAALAA